LTVRKVRISLLASLGSVPSGVEEVEGIDVSGGELGSVDGELTEESSSLVESGNV